MLELRAKSFFSNDYIVEENGVVVAELCLLPPLRLVVGEIIMQGQSLKLVQHGWFRDHFEAFDDGILMMEAAQPIAFQSRLVLKFEGQEFEIVGDAPNLAVKSKGSLVGRTRLKGSLFRRWTEVDLPETFPLGFRIFIGWIATKIRG